MTLLGVILMLLRQLWISGILWFSVRDSYVVIGVSEPVLLKIFLPGCLRRESITIAVFVVSVVPSAGSVVLRCRAEATRFLLTGMPRLLWTSICWLVRLRLATCRKSTDWS